METFDRTIAVNLRGVFLGLRAALAQLREQGDGGAIVVTASTAGVSGSELAAYSASKHGAVALMRTAAIEGARFGVRANAIAPGSIDTPMMGVIERALGGGEQARRAIRAGSPLGRCRIGSGMRLKSQLSSPSCSAMRLRGSPEPRWR